MAEGSKAEDRKSLGTGVYQPEDPWEVRERLLVRQPEDPWPEDPWEVRERFHLVAGALTHSCIHDVPLSLPEFRQGLGFSSTAKEMHGTVPFRIGTRRTVFATGHIGSLFLAGHSHKNDRDIVISASVVSKIAHFVALLA